MPSKLYQVAYHPTTIKRMISMDIIILDLVAQEHETRVWDTTVCNAD